MGPRVWSGGEIFSKKKQIKNVGHIKPPLPSPIIIKVKENSIIAGLGACKSYECYQNPNYFPALVKEYVILEVQLDSLDGLQCF